MNTFFNCLISEFFKLKRAPVLWLLLFGGLAISCLVLFRFVSDDYYLVQLNKNPWDYFLDFGFNILTIFFIIPIVILMVSYVVFLEDHSSTWKYLYTLPVKKGYIYFSKLLMVIILIIFLLFIFSLCMLIAAYILDGFIPEFEFNYYMPDWLTINRFFIHLFISLLGVLGFQYFVSMQHKHFLVPIGIGFLGFIVGFILVVTGNSLGAYFPFTYPAHVNQSFIKKTVDLNINSFGGLGILEWYSIFIFFFFVGVGYLQEKFRNVK